jgi:hypothetical protein
LQDSFYFYLLFSSSWSKINFGVDVPWEKNLNRVLLFIPGLPETRDPSASYSQVVILYFYHRTSWIRGSDPSTWEAEAREARLQNDFKKFGKKNMFVLLLNITWGHQEKSIFLDCGNITRDNFWGVN